jgi:hypothetical protein
MNEMSPYTGAPSTGNPILSGDSGHAPQVALLTCRGLSALLGTDGIRYQTCWLCTNTTKFLGACQGRPGVRVVFTNRCLRLTFSWKGDERWADTPSRSGLEAL